MRTTQKQIEDRYGDHGITLYAYREGWDNCSLVIAYGLFRIIQSLTTMWFISEKDILIVHYLAKTRGRFETLQQRCHKLAFELLQLKLCGERGHKSTNLRILLKAPLPPNHWPLEINVSVSEALFVLFFPETMLVDLQIKAEAPL